MSYGMEKKAKEQIETFFKETLQQKNQGHPLKSIATKDLLYTLVSLGKEKVEKKKEKKGKGRLQRQKEKSIKAALQLFRGPLQGYQSIEEYVRVLKP